MDDADTKSKGRIKTVGRLTYYTFDGVYLIVVPGKNMMWQDWLRTAEAIMGFTFEWDAVALQFDVLVAGMKVGAGILSDFEEIAELGLVEGLGSQMVYRQLVRIQPLHHAVQLSAVDFQQEIEKTHSLY